MAFAVNTAARLLLTPRNGGPLTTRQASLNAADRQVASPNRAFDAGLRPGPFPDRAPSLLPSLLAATRTGLTPAGDDELMLDQLLTQHLQLWAHARSGLARAQGLRPAAQAHDASRLPIRCERPHRPGLWHLAIEDLTSDMVE